MEALKTEGYITAAVNHPGNTTMDDSGQGVVRVWERAEDLTRLLDTLLSDPAWQDRIDAERIGAAGFSSGGYTVLALGGAKYEASRLAEYCASEDHGPDCDLADPNLEVDFAGSERSYKDERIQAIFAMAPAVGQAITEQSLREFTAPVTIPAAKDDELVYPKYSAEHYAKHIPNAVLTLLPEGGHFIFLQCNVGTRIADWFIDHLDLCGKNFDVDREQVRNTVATQAVDFFNLHLQKDS